MYPGPQVQGPQGLQPGQEMMPWNNQVGGGFGQQGPTLQPAFQQIPHGASGMAPQAGAVAPLAPSFPSNVPPAEPPASSAPAGQGSAPGPSAAPPGKDSFPTKAWRSIVKKADSHTPVQLSLTPCSGQALAVFIMFCTFAAAVIFSVLSNTLYCSKENGCISCVVKTFAPDSTEQPSDYNMGCDPIAHPFLEFEFPRCSTGQALNSKGQMEALNGEKSKQLISKIKSLCEKSLVTNCEKTGQAGTTVQGKTVDSCFHTSTCSTKGMVWPTGTIMSDCSIADNLDFTKYMQTGVTTTMLIYNEDGQMVDVDIEKLQKHRFFNTFSPSAARNMVMGEVMRLRTASCWIEQLYEELTKPGAHPESASAQGKFSLGFVQSGNNAGMLFRPGPYASKCGGTNSSVLPVGEWYGLYVQRFEYTTFGTVHAGSAEYPEILSLSNIDESDCGIGCAMGNPAIIDPKTGQNSCCSRPSWSDVVSVAYAFGLLWMSGASIIVAGFVACVWGTRFVDMEALQEMAAGHEAVGEAKARASAAI